MGKKYEINEKFDSSQLPSPGSWMLKRYEKSLTKGEAVENLKKVNEIIAHRTEIEDEFVGILESINNPEIDLESLKRRYVKAVTKGFELEESEGPHDLRKNDQILTMYFQKKVLPLVSKEELFDEIVDNLAEVRKEKMEYKAFLN